MCVRCVIISERVMFLWWLLIAIVNITYMTEADLLHLTRLRGDEGRQTKMKVLSEISPRLSELNKVAIQRSWTAEELNEYEELQKCIDLITASLEDVFVQSVSDELI